MFAKHTPSVVLHSLYVQMIQGCLHVRHSVISKKIEIKFFGTGVNIIDIQ